MLLISNFRLYDLQSDVIAGLTVALTVIPQSLAYANIANLPPQVISSISPGIDDSYILY